MKERNKVLKPMVKIYRTQISTRWGHHKEAKSRGQMSKQTNKSAILLISKIELGDKSASDLLHYFNNLFSVIHFYVSLQKNSDKNDKDVSKKIWVGAGCQTVKHVGWRMMWCAWWWRLANRATIQMAAWNSHTTAACSLLMFKHWITRWII